MPKGAFIIDTKSFDKEFTRIVCTAIPKLASEALYQQGFELLRYAILEEPRAPHKSGTLWNSQRVDTPVIRPDVISVSAGFNCEYAARLHEAPGNWNWTLAGSGPKFLESKLVKHRLELMQHVADKIKGGAK